MAALAIMRVGIAKGTSGVVACHTALRARVGEMLCWYDGTDLSCSSQPASPNRVTSLTRQTALPVVISVTKTHPVGSSRYRGR